MYMFTKISLNLPVFWYVFNVPAMICHIYRLQGTLKYPDTRYLDASVSGRFFLGIVFFYVILSHLSGIPLSGSGRSVFTIKCIFTLYFGSLIRTGDFDDRCLSTLVNFPKLGVNCCKNTGLAYCFNKTTCDNVWPIVCNSLCVTRLHWPVIWIRNTYLIKLNAFYWIFKKLITYLVIGNLESNNICFTYCYL